MSYGYLNQKPELRSNWPHSIPIIDILKREVLTRYEEYNFALEEVKKTEPGLVLDAACGWIGGLHIFSHLVANETDNAVVALDSNPEHLIHQTPHPWICRLVGDLTGLPFAEQNFTATVCLSSLEHLKGMYLSLAIAHLCRVTKDTLIITADGLNVKHIANAVKIYMFDPGEETELPEHPLINDKGERVCYLVAKRTDGWIMAGNTPSRRGDSGT